MTRIQEPAISHLVGRYLGTHLRGVKGVDRLLRTIHNPDKRQDTWLETIAGAIPDGPDFYLSTRWFSEWTTWFYGSVDDDIYRWIRSNAQADWVGFDVGMNFGFFACVLAQRCAQSHGFEPVPWIADRAEANSKLNHFTNLLMNRIALSNEAGEAELFVPSPDDANWGKSSILRNTIGASSPLRISTDTLDRYVSKNGLNRLDFIKIDVEGAEHLVLQGAIESLKTFHPAVVFEVNPESIEQCLHLLRSIGYKLFDLSGSQLPTDIKRSTHDVLAKVVPRSPAK